MHEWWLGGMGKSDSPLSATAPRGKGNVRGVFWEVKGTWGACRYLGKTVDLVKKSKWKVGETWLTLLYPVHPIHHGLIFWTPMDVLKWKGAVLEHRKGSKLRPGDRDKGYLPVCLIIPFLASHIVAQCSQSLCGIALTIW